MATMQDVIAAIFAMDAYNQGYSPGMTLRNDQSIDGADIVTDSSRALGNSADDASFYSIAYSLDGETFIAYRGTQLSSVSSALGDVLNGWTISGGYSAASQAQFALQFYKDIVTATGGDFNDILLTGHSLGGGLAGFVADVEGARADIFDNIPFGSAVLAEAGTYAQSQGLSLTLSNALSELSVSSSAQINQFITNGEVATGLRVATPLLSTLYFRAQTGNSLWSVATAAYGLYLDQSTNSQTLYSYSGIASPVALHSMSLSVLLTFASAKSYTACSLLVVLYNAEFNQPSIAQDLRITSLKSRLVFARPGAANRHRLFRRARQLPVRHDSRDILLRGRRYTGSDAE